MNRTHGSTSSYTTGFAVSIVLTVAAFAAASRLHGITLVATIIGLAFVQLVIQLVLFLHLGRERGAKWNTLAFGFMALVAATIVAGSWWIMAHLNYHMATPKNIDDAIMTDEGIHR